jgi:hypothetical protein
MGYIERYLWRQEMPWEERNKADERVKLVTRLFEGETLATWDSELKYQENPVTRYTKSICTAVLKG